MENNEREMGLFKEAPKSEERRDRVIVALRKRIEKHVKNDQLSDIKRMHYVGLIHNTKSYSVN